MNHLNRLLTGSRDIYVRSKVILSRLTVDFVAFLRAHYVFISYRKQYFGFSVVNSGQALVKFP